jgi:hypothetical protein
MGMVMEVLLEKLCHEGKKTRKLANWWRFSLPSSNIASALFFHRIHPSKN